MTRPECRRFPSQGQSHVSFSSFVDRESARVAGFYLAEQRFRASCSKFFSDGTARSAVLPDRFDWQHKQARKRLAWPWPRLDHAVS